MPNESLRRDARAIWDAAVGAVRPDDLVRRAVTRSGTALTKALAPASRVVVVGGGKAGAGMAAGLEAGLADRLDRLTGLINIPAGTERPLRSIRLHVARSSGSNHPTADGVAGSEAMLKLVASAGMSDVVVCLLSGGGSALLPAPAAGITLADKQAVTRLLHECGATIGEMNAIRKHLSRIKGGGLIRESRAGQVFSLILSDVVGDPLDVIASGPTAPDPTTFGDCTAVLKRYGLMDRVPLAVGLHLNRGAAGDLPETLKTLPATVHNEVLANNATALRAAKAHAKSLGYNVVNLGAFIEGETREVATAAVGVARSIATDTEPAAPPACILMGGETTVTLPSNIGRGGRNTEFALAAALTLNRASLHNAVVLSCGTDGEDGPTDATGAVADSASVTRGRSLGLEPLDALKGHDSYSFFSATGDLVRVGLTGTNVMDVRLILVGN